MRSFSGADWGRAGGSTIINPQKTMKKSVARSVAALVMLAVTSLPAPSAFAQGSDQKAPDGKPKDGGRAEEIRKRIDEIAEVGRQLTGPAANPECYWLGQKVINLLVRDDLDTAFRHLDLYDRFGCPGGHIQSTFRCLVRQGADIAVDPKAPEPSNNRIQACWINPATPPQQQQAPAATAEQPAGTTSR
jgi:hypothetical protein